MVVFLSEVILKGSGRLGSAAQDRIAGRDDGQRAAGGEEFLDPLGKGCAITGRCHRASMP